MTGPDDLAVVRRLMQEAGLEDDDALPPVLLDVRRLRQGPPVPSAEVAALMAGGRRRRGTRTGVVVALAVTASLGAGLSAAAASPAVRDTAARAVEAFGAPAVERPSLPRIEVTTAGRPAPASESAASAGRRTAETPPAGPSTGAFSPSAQGGGDARQGARGAGHPGASASPPSTPVVSGSADPGTTSGRGGGTSSSHRGDRKDGPSGAAEKHRGVSTVEIGTETRD